MKKGWEMKKLSDICEFINGRAYNKNELLSKGKYRVLRVGNFFTNNHWYYSNLELEQNKYCDKGDLLYAWSASFGPRIWNHEKVIFHYHIWKVVPNEKYVTKEFLYKILEWDVDKIKRDQGTGTTMMHVGKSSMDNRIVPVPPISEQRRIVELLDKAFLTIEKANNNIEKNLTNAKILFESYLQNVFFNRNGDWDLRNLGEISKINYGFTDSASFKEIGPKFLRITDIQNNEVDWDSVPYCDCKHPDISKFILHSGDIVFARTGATTGKSYLVENPPNSVFASYLIRLRLLSVFNVLPQYVFFYFQTKQYWEKIKFGVSGSAQGGFNASKLSNILLPYPKDVEEQRRIVEKLNMFQTEANALKNIYLKKLNELEKFKKSIFQKAFNGELAYHPELITA